MNGQPSPYKPVVAARSPDSSFDQCCVEDCNEPPTLVADVGSFTFPLCTRHAEDLAGELHSRLRAVADENAKPLCSICRKRHGLEIIHECE